MLDHKWINHEFEPHTATISDWHLKFFAHACQSENRIFSDEKEALNAGYKALPVPLTFGFILNMVLPDPLQRYLDIGIDLKRLLHGGQRFEYGEPLLAGDDLTIRTRIADIYAKKGGKMEFVEEEVVGELPDGKTAFKGFTTLIIRN